MKPTVPLALALCLTLPLAVRAQQSTQTFTDPANLRGERVSPSDGHELPIDQGSSGLAQLLRKLNTRASLLLITAHPDDEDGGMLTLYSRGLGARVATLTLNRGEGGQNFMTDDFEDALGLIRTQELLSADRYFDADQMFGTEVDFGFSKTKEESFQKWTHERVLYDAVRAIRLYRPLVIAAVFVGGVTDGHGQHQVSGEIAQEAFKAAADPTVFPDMIREGILPWQALKVYARVPWANVSSKGVFDSATNQYTSDRFTNYVTGQVTTTKPSADVIVPEGATDPLLTYAAACDQSVLSTESPHNSVLSTGAPGNSVLSTEAIGNSVLSTGAPNKSVISTKSPHNSVLSTEAIGNSVLSTEAQRSGETCSSALPTTPLSYVQFARIGLGLQRTQISRNMRLPSPGKYDSPYHLYGSVLCNAPADARVPIKNAVILSGARSAQSKDPCILPAAALPPSSSYAPAPNREQAPTARPITAQGNALGKDTNESTRAESPIYNADLTNQPNFFTGIDTSIEGIATLAPQLPMAARAILRNISYSISLASSTFEATHSPHSQQNKLATDVIANPLARALMDTDALISGLEASRLPPDQKANVLHELRIKRVQLNDALTLALGLRLDATAPSNDLVENSSPEIKTSLSESNLSTDPVTLSRISINGAAPNQRENLNTPAPQQLTAATPIDHDWQIPSDHLDVITQPYFYRDNIEQPVYKLRDPALRNAPQTPAPLTAWATVNYQGAEITLGRIVHDGPQPVSIVPPISIASAPAATVLPTGQPTAQLTATLRTDATTSANINVQSPHNWTIQAKAVPAPAADPTHSVNFFLHPTAPISGPQLFHVAAQTPDHHTYTEGFRPAGYPGLIYTNYYTPATTRVVPIDLKMPALKLPAHLRIAYLPGTGDAVPEALASIGLTPTLLTVSDLTPTKLANFDTIILGVRTYAAHPDLHGAPTQALLDFARNGGNVLVQYQTSNFTSADAPYPLSLGNAEKVVVETDPVKLLTPRDSSGYPEASASGLIAEKRNGASAPRYALLNAPNQITPADFDNWVEERGHGFLETWDPHYTALTETHDPAQLPQLGGLITTPVGPNPNHQGRWTYCAFALYRQLPEAVPGAFRLFVNLITPTP